MPKYNYAPPGEEQEKEMKSLLQWEEEQEKEMKSLLQWEEEEEKDTKVYTPPGESRRKRWNPSPVGGGERLNSRGRD